MAEDTGAPRRREGRPHIIPPAPGWRVDAQGRPEGWPVLDDVDGALGLTLWRALRAVWTWVDTPPERRGGLSQEPTREVRERFAYAAMEAPELESAFGTFAMLARAADMLDGTRVAEACHVVHIWADARGLTETAVHFAEAAARADADDALRANLAGRTCRRAGLNDRSAAWFLRAFRLAVRTRSRREAIRALLGYGALLKELGRHVEARTVFQRAARRAERTGRRRQAAEAYHDLLTIAAEIGTIQEAAAHFRQALRLYPSRHPYLPSLAHDFAWLLVRLHHYSAAVPLLDLVLTRTPRPAVETVVLATLARAAACTGKVARFQEVEPRVLQLARMHDEFAPAAFIHLAEGARAFRDWGKAERYATAAIEAAHRREQSLVESDALSLLGQVARQEPSPREQPVPEPEVVRALTRRIAVRLQNWKPSRPDQFPDPIV
ncbi:MAG TPA: tetratricopeptide repeat protein [Longimicrobium sp.]